MSVMILDAGNSIIKAKIANSEIAFPHAIQSLRMNTPGGKSNTHMTLRLAGL